ncbi:hypothetical protein PA598K_06672 [Paenibacillus sp. 598K]|uniref:S1C family serine protease n=1 Tax=Paenibacillus sp. 598K TaxID=1117987 RepID=UPI000FFAEEFF|nr:trypsin-like peptidase domain-containing protein [Paenibacillus sp. 598K]GBF78069.1 hypothetical protein PA598K_06672 [Paenibacillus sp. 598K]
MDRKKRDFTDYYDEIQKEMQQENQTSDVMNTSRRLYITDGESSPNLLVSATSNGDQQEKEKLDCSTSAKKRLRFKKRVSFLAGGIVAIIVMLASGVNPFSSDHTMGHQQSSGISSANITTTSTSISTNQNVISSIVQQSNGAVVLIKTYTKSSSRETRSLNDPFWYFFGGGNEQPKSSNDGQLRLYGAGSGFFYKKGGYILTNEHVIANADQIEVTVDGTAEPFKATVLGKSAEHDLAVIKIDSKQDFPILKMGDSNAINVGDWVVAIGNPAGFENTVTVGVISAKEREIPINDNNGQRQYRHLLQTDASINSGNSGGPLINLNGEVIGMNTAKSSEAQGIGFAIPTSVFVPFINYLEEGKSIPSSYIGVSLTDIREEILDDLNLNSVEGALVAQVLPGTPAFKAGIRQYDVIVKINGQAVEKSKDVVNQVLALPIGEKISLTVLRDGKETDFIVIVEDKNAS